MADVPEAQPGKGSLVLASASPRRRVALACLGLTPPVIPAAVEETVLPGERPVDAASRLAALKARAVGRAHPEQWVIAADTLVIGPDGKPLGKPANPAEARATLERLRCRRHQVVTAQAVVRHDRLLQDHLSTLVTMRGYTDAEIADYIESGDPFDKAGSYAIQHPTFRPVQFLDGCYLNVVGLPICRTRQLLRTAGYPEPLPDLEPPWCACCRLAAAGSLRELSASSR